MEIKPCKNATFEQLSSYNCSFENIRFSIFQNSVLIGVSSLIDKLYRLNTVILMTMT